VKGDTLLTEVNARAHPEKQGARKNGGRSPNKVTLPKFERRLSGRGGNPYGPMGENGVGGVKNGKTEGGGRPPDQAGQKG